MKGILSLIFITLTAITFLAVLPNNTLALSPPPEEEEDQALSGRQQENKDATDSQAAALEEQAATLRQDATVLEAQAASIQAVNPTGTQTLLAQAAELRRQSDTLMQQARDLRTATTKTAAGETKPQILPQYKLIVPIPGFAPGNEANPLAYIVAIYNVAIAAGGLIAMGIIVFAGLKWATSAGNQSAISEARDLLLHAIYGLVMLMGATLILYTIGGESFTKLTLPTLTNVTPTEFDFAETAEAWAKANENWRAANQEHTKTRDEAEAANKAIEAKNAKGEKVSLEEKIDAQRKTVAYALSQYNRALADLEILKLAYEGAVARCEASWKCKYDPYSDEAYRLRAAVTDNYKQYQEAETKAKNAYDNYAAQDAALKKLEAEQSK